MPQVDLGVVRPVIKGDYIALLDYEVLNIVRYEAAWYIARVPVPASLNALPSPVSTVWDRISPDTISMSEGDARYLQLAGGTLVGALSGVAPTLAAHLTRKDYVDGKVASLLDSAPAALDTLNELAAALGDDANFAATMANALGDKASIAYVNSLGIGVDQTWQDMSASRLNNTIYTNTTGKPIEVAIYATSFNTLSVLISVGNKGIAYSAENNGIGAQRIVSARLIIPKNATYSLTANSGGAIDARYVYELR